MNEQLKLDHDIAEAKVRLAEAWGMLETLTKMSINEHLYRTVYSAALHEQDRAKEALGKLMVSEYTQA